MLLPLNVAGDNQGKEYNSTTSGPLRIKKKKRRHVSIINMSEYTVQTVKEKKMFTWTVQ